MIFPYFKNHMPDIFEDLYQEIDWERDMMIVHGVPAIQQKQTAIFSLKGDKVVKWGKKDLPSLEMSTLMKAIRLDILRLGRKENINLGNLNFCLANLYRDEIDQMGWHHDRKINRELDTDPIVSVSYGESREFEWKSKTDDYDRHMEFLGGGDVFFMMGGFQNEYEHRIPPSAFVCKPRINLTFRSETQ